MAKKPEYTDEERRRSLGGHGSASMKARDELRRRGVPQSQLDNIPSWDATGGAFDFLNVMKRIRKAGGSKLPGNARASDFTELAQYDTDPTVRGIDMDAVRRARILRGDLRDKPKKKASGGKVKKMAKGGSASSRADGIARKGKTRGKVC